MNKQLTFICLGVLLTSATALSQSTDISVKTLMGGLRARHIGPAVMSGRISDIEVVNRRPEIIYVGSAGGGVWKSVSGSANFRPVFDEYTQSIGKVTVDQSHPDTVWVGTGEPWVRNSVGVGTGIYKSYNGGSTWEFSGLGDSEHIADIIIHPANGNTVFVAAQGHLWGPHPERGVFKTEDGGKTWNKVLYIDENTGCADLAMDPKNPDVLYAAMWSHRRYPDFFDSGFTGTSGLYKSVDGGKTWNKIHNGLPNATLGRIGIAVAPSNGSVLYASVEAKEKEHKGLYKSTDAGASWKRINNDFNTTVRPFYFSRIEVDPNSDSTVAKCGLNMIISTDGGKRFRVAGGSVHSDYHDIWFDPNNSKHILVATDGGVYESVDGAFSFKMWMNLPVGQFYHVSVDNETPYNVYGGLQDNSAWFGPSQKSGGITHGDWTSTVGGDGFWSFRHPTDPDVVYAEWQGGNLIRYNKKTGVSKDIKPYPAQGEPKFRFNWNAPIQLSPTNPERLYFGAQYLFMSEDKGDTWKRLSPDLTTNDPKRQRQAQSGGLSIDNSTAENNTTIYTIGESPRDQRVVWAGTDDGNLQVTENQGASWTNVAPNIKGIPAFAWCSHVEPGHFDRSTAYVSFDNHRAGDMKPYIYKTTDLGKTWTSLVTDDIKGHVFIIREDLKNANILFAGTELGLYISLDGGKKWGRFDNNLPPVAVHDMVIHPTTDDLVLATHGRSIVIIDDISPLRQITPEVLTKSIHFLESKPTLLRDPGAGGGWFGGDGNFVGQNPSTNARIIYYMSKRHTFGKMSVEVYDQEGKLLKELPAGKSAGINVVEMVSAMEKPRAAPSDNPQAIFGSLFGPNFPEGTYKVKVIKGKEEFLTSFTLKYPDNSPYTAEDRKVQREQTMKLYTLTERMAYIYAVQEGLVNQARATLDKNPKLTKTLKPFIDELDKYNGTLVFRGGDMYINTDDMAAERISDIYGKVSSYPGRPSNSQIDQVAVLERDMKAIETQFTGFTGGKLAKVNAALTKAGVGTLKVPTEEEWRKGSTQSSSGGWAFRTSFPLYPSLR
jgi:photosystem II stability/assembly factor-like uncharacterized protein